MKITMNQIGAFGPKINSPKQKFKALLAQTKNTLMWLQENSWSSSRAKRCGSTQQGQKEWINSFIVPNQYNVQEKRRSLWTTQHYYAVDSNCLYTIPTHSRINTLLANSEPPLSHLNVQIYITTPWRSISTRRTDPPKTKFLTRFCEFDYLLVSLIKQWLTFKWETKTQRPSRFRQRSTSFWVSSSTPSIATRRSSFVSSSAMLLMYVKSHTQNLS